MTNPREIHPQHILEGDADDILVTGKNARGEDATEWKSKSEADIAAASDLAAHLADSSDAHDASAISSVAAGTLSSTNVQDALNELDTEKATTGSVSTVATDLANHLADTSDAHDASAVSYAGDTGVSATDVEAALDEGFARDRLQGTYVSEIMRAQDLAQDAIKEATRLDALMERKVEFELSNKADLIHTHDNVYGPACLVYNTSATVVTCTLATTWYAVPFTSETFDTDNLHSTVSDTSRVYLRKRGVWGFSYTIIATAGTYAGADQFFYSVVAKNGSSSDLYAEAGQRTDTTLGTQQPICGAAGICYSDGDDYIEVWAQHTGIAGLAVVSGTGGQGYCFLQAHWIRP